MAQQVFGPAAVVSVLNRAFTNTSPSNSVFENQVAAAGTSEASQLAFAQQFGAQFAVGKTAAELSTLLLTNIGISNAILEAALTDYIAANGESNIGIIAWQLSSVVSTKEGDVTFGEAAAKWNQEVTSAYQYSSSPNNNTPQSGDDGSGTTPLSRFTDVLTGHEFSGYLDYNQFTGSDEQTLTDSDRLTGTSATDDVLYAQLAGGITTPTLNGIELVSVDAKANSTLSLGNANGVTTVGNVNTSEGLALGFTNLKNLVDVVIKNTNSDTTVAFNGSVVAGVADALNLTVDGAGVKARPANFTVNGIETLNITASENASVLGTVNSVNVSAVTIQGDQDLTVGSKAAGGFNSANITTVDADTATGNLTLNLSASAARDQTVKTGTGDDVVVTGTLSATDTFNLGDGNDRVVLTSTNSNQAAMLVGVEEVEARVAGTNLNLTNAANVNLLAVAEGAGFANVTAVKSGTSVVFEGAGQANTVSNAIVNFGGVQYNLANATGASDVINFKFNNAGLTLGANSTVAIGALNNSGNNVETINLAFSDVTATTTVTVADINGNTTALKTLNVTSESKVTLNDVNDLTKLTLVDATGVDGAFTANFGALADAASAVVKLGGSGVNNVVVDKAENLGGAAATTTNTLLTVDASAGTGNQTLSVANNDTNTTPTLTNPALLAKAGVSAVGGAGDDTITVASVAATVSLIKGGAGADIINIAGAGVDVLSFAIGDSTASNKDLVTDFTTGQDKINLLDFGFDVALHGVAAPGNALNGTANEFANQAVAAFSVGGSTTVYVDVNGDNKLDANDLVVQLVGTAAVAVGDFMFV